SKCCTTTKAMPVSPGSASSSCETASRPPADAPIPTTANPFACCARSAFSRALASPPFSSGADGLSVMTGVFRSRPWEWAVESCKKESITLQGTHRNYHRFTLVVGTNYIGKRPLHPRSTLASGAWENVRAWFAQLKFLAGSPDGLELLLSNFLRLRS